MQSFTARILEMTGLHNDVLVVIDPEAKGCAYATTVAGQQYIGIDPKCVGPLSRNGVYQWRAIGILAHEIGHLLSGHTTNQKRDNPAEESAADQWSGWAMFRLGASLEQAQTVARSMNPQGSSTHPGRRVRLASVERGWTKARAESVTAGSRSINDHWWAKFMKTPVPWAGK